MDWMLIQFVGHVVPHLMREAGPATMGFGRLLVRQLESHPFWLSGMRTGVDRLSLMTTKRVLWEAVGGRSPR